MARRTRKDGERHSQSARPRNLSSGGQAADHLQAHIVRLQRLAGNRAVSGLLAPDQAERHGGASAEVRAALEGAGRPLDPGVRASMEKGLGHGLPDVRVHTDGPAARSARDLDARAYTVGRDVLFAAGQYEPGTAEGRWLLAHELAHVVQHARLGSAGPTGRVSAPGDPAEREAASVADAVVRGGPVPAVVTAGSGVHRDDGKIKEKPAPDPAMLTEFAKKFPDAAKHINKSDLAMKLVKEAAAAGVGFGGYAEDGPSKLTWPYTIPSEGKVYVPKARTDPVVAASDFLFELNNAVASPRFVAIDEEAAKGTKGKLSAKEYARKNVEIEVEGMLRTGEIWFQMKTALGGGRELDKYDRDWFLASYQAVKAGKKTKEDVVKGVLAARTGADRSKTTEEFYMDQYKKLSGGK
jgi:Domain of unknown function (DUF4157)